MPASLEINFVSVTGTGSDEASIVFSSRGENSWFGSLFLSMSSLTAYRIRCYRVRYYPASLAVVFVMRSSFTYLRFEITLNELHAEVKKYNMLNI